MKKLKCEECGGHLTVEENGEYATCEYCETRYKLNEDKKVIIKIDDGDNEITPLTKEQQEHLDKTMNKSSIIITIIILIIFGSIGFIIFTQVTTENKEMFNNKYEYKVGAKSGSTVENLLSDVITNNKTNKKHKITVVYKDKKTDDPAEIEKIKDQTSDIWSLYEVSADYDNKGYINVITIKDKGKG